MYVSRVRYSKCYLLLQRFMTNSSTIISDPKFNIDYKDVEHHALLGDKWWNLKGPMKGLHSMNELRVPFIRDGLISTGKVNSRYIDTSKALSELQLLEVGCGGGILTEPLARLGAKIIGLDASSELIALAKTHIKTQENISNNITYTVNSIEEFAKFNIECFDAVIISEVLEHIKAKDTFLEACVKTLKQEGSIFVTTINKNVASWMCGIIAAENVLKIVPPNTHDWEKFIAPHETQRLLEINNCFTHKLHGMFYQFWNNQWIWCSNTDINYALHAVKQNRALDVNAYHEK